MGKEKLILDERIVQWLVGLRKRCWVDYDAEADVLYISFRKPQKADDSVMEDDVIYHYSGSELVGVTVLNASLWRQTDSGRRQ